MHTLTWQLIASNMAQIRVKCSNQGVVTYIHSAIVDSNVSNGPPEGQRQEYVNDLLSETELTPTIQHG